MTKFVNVALAAGAAYLLLGAINKGTQPAPFTKVKSDTFAQINAAEQAGRITPDIADGLRRQFGNINDSQSGVDFINAASRAGVFIRPREHVRVKVPGRLPGESMRRTAERQRAQLKEVARKEAERTGISDISKETARRFAEREAAGGRKGKTPPKISKAATQAAQANDYGVFQNIVDSAAAFAQSTKDVNAKRHKIHDLAQRIRLTADGAVKNISPTFNPDGSLHKANNALINTIRNNERRAQAAVAQLLR